MIRLRSSYFVAALLAACTPVEDNREVDAPAADTTPPGIVKSTPADMAKKVSVLQPLTVVFDEDVDAATVTAATVELSWADDKGYAVHELANTSAAVGPTMPKHLVPAVVTYDEVSRTLRLVPKAPLPYGQRFTLALTGVKDVVGNPLTTSVKFLTSVNLATRTRSFDLNAQPVPGYKLQPPDANGFPDEALVVSGAGTDTIWFNTDDIVTVFFDVVAKPNGQLLIEFLMDDGIDAVLHSPDDVKRGAFEHKYDAEGRPTELVAHLLGDEGPDMMLGTPDDLISGLMAFKYQGGLLSSRTLFDEPGLVDMAWRTADDQCETGSGGLVDMAYDMMGRRTREIHKDCGTDRLPVTPDDTFVEYLDYQWDANHAVTRSVLRNGPGLNTTWLDGDDVIASTETWTVDANGLPTEYRYYSGPGMTNNDISTLTKSTYNANKQLILVATYGKGIDTDLGTNDDVIDSYTQTTYDALGNRIRSRTFDVGPDLAAYSGDDRLLIDIEFDTMH